MLGRARSGWLLGPEILLLPVGFISIEEERACTSARVFGYGSLPLSENNIRSGIVAAQQAIFRPHLSNH